MREQRKAFKDHFDRAAAKQLAKQLADQIHAVHRRFDRSPKRKSLMIDYAVQYVRLGGRSSDKVFKWKSITLEPGERITVSKTHPMKVTTVRKLYSGRHRVVVQVNGQRLAEASFVLI